MYLPIWLRHVQRRLFGFRPATVQRRRGQQRPPLFIESLEDRTLLSATLPISVDPTGTTMGNQASQFSLVSANGQYAVFVSSATNLASGVTIQANSRGHVYLRNLSTGTTTLVDVDVNNPSESGNADSGSGSITPDGRYLAFESYATDLTNNDSTASIWQIYVRDMQTGQTYLVSLGDDGNPQNTYLGNTENEYPPVADIAEDGNGHLLIAYQSNSTNLTQGDANHTHQQIFLATLKLDSSGNIQYGSLQTSLVSQDNSGTGNGGNYGSGGYDLSKDGSTLAFTSAATNLNVPGGYIDDNPNLDNLFLYSVADQTLKLLSAEPTTGANATGNGSLNLANAGGANIFDNFSSSSPYQESVSANGQYVLFTGSSDNLVPTVYGYALGSNLYLRNLSTGTTSRVGIIGNGDTIAIGGQPAVMTPDGRYVAFVNSSQYANSQVFVSDMQQERTYLVSLGTDGNPANKGVFQNGQISIAENSNNQLVIAYQSESTTLTKNDTNSSTMQVFVATLNLDSNGNIQYNTLSTVLPSADSTGNGGDGDSGDPIFSKDGSTLAFESYADNLPGETPGDAGHVQVFTYNLASNALTQVSPVPPSGDTADSSELSSISDNGQYLAYDYLDNKTGNSWLYAWNANTKTNTAINSATGNDPGDVPRISGDGSAVVYGLNDSLYAASNWQGGSPTTTTVGTGSPNIIYGQFSISDNGQFIAYASGTEVGGGSISQVFVYNAATQTTTLASPSTGGGAATASPPRSKSARTAAPSPTLPRQPTCLPTTSSTSTSVRTTSSPTTWLATASA